jgi:hypothetical protein
MLSGMRTTGTTRVAAVAATGLIGLIGASLAPPPALAAYAHPQASNIINVATLGGVSIAPGTRDAWAAGSDQRGAGAHAVVSPLVEHRVSGTWRKVVTGLPDSVTLNAVSAASPTEVFLAGVNQPAGHSQVPYLTESTGGAFHSVVLPRLGPGVIYAMSASSATNVWAAGALSTRGGVPVVLHWNGKTWARVPTGTAGSGLNSLSISTSGPKNVWIDSRPGAGRVSLRRWNGKRWHTTRVAGRPSRALLYVATTSRDQAWAVTAHEVRVTNGSVDEALAWHWNGQAWTSIPIPVSPDTDYQVPAQVAARGSTAYFVGEIAAGSGASQAMGLVVRLSATRCTFQTAAQVADDTTQFFAVAESSKLKVLVGVATTRFSTPQTRKAVIDEQPVGASTWTGAGTPQ